MTNAQKVSVLKLLESGRTPTAIAKAMNLPVSSVRKLAKVGAVVEPVGEIGTRFAELPDGETLPVISLSTTEKWNKEQWQEYVARLAVTSAMAMEQMLLDPSVSAHVRLAIAQTFIDREAAVPTSQKAAQAPPGVVVYLNQQTLELAKDTLKQVKRIEAQ